MVLAGALYLKLEMLPWKGNQFSDWLIALGIMGLLSVILAVAGKLRFLLPLWSFYVLGMLLKGVFLTPNVTFAGQSDFRNWLWLICGAALAMSGGISLMGERRGLMTY